MYDGLVKKIRHCATDPMHCLSCDEPKDGPCFVRLMTQAADAIEEMSKRLDESIPKSDAEIIIEELSKPRWIPVTERLPEHDYGEGDSVLAVSSLGSMRVLYFDGGNWCYPTGEALTTARKYPITHWMPLPEPPKEE